MIGNHSKYSFGELEYRWPAVVRNATGWEKGFALSIAKNLRRKKWKPTPKQEAQMQRMVSDLMRPRSIEEPEDFSLIEA
jgi:hypothetical protein